ncbi:MAG: cytochrome C [Burkholderiaceae bacterium]
MRRASIAARLLPLLMLLLAGRGAGAEAVDMVLGRIVLPPGNAPSVVATTSPRAHYVLHCAGCHGLDGAGAPEKYVPDLRQLGAFFRVDGGRSFMIQVPGVMGSGLDDRQVAEVVNWLLATLARASVSEAVAPFTADEVARARAQPLVDVAAVRARLVQQAQARGVALP